MSETAFRHRGLRVVVDTTEKAEFSIRGYQISDAMMERVARQLRESVFLGTARSFGDLWIREIEGYDFVYLIGREQDKLVFTIGAVEPVDPENPIDAILDKLGPLALLRGATGL